MIAVFVLTSPPRVNKWIKTNKQTNKISSTFLYASCSTVSWLLGCPSVHSSTKFCVTFSFNGICDSLQIWYGHYPWGVGVHWHVFLDPMVFSLKLWLVLEVRVTLGQSVETAVVKILMHIVTGVYMCTGIVLGHWFPCPWTCDLGLEILVTPL